MFAKTALKAALQIGLRHYLVLLPARCSLLNMAIKTTTTSSASHGAFEYHRQLLVLAYNAMPPARVFFPWKMRRCEARCDGGDFLGISGGSNLSQNGKSRRLARH
jgi:ABC-type thiamine transport system substrate-binding protein